jgi:rsbT antagonist protein RsbS
MHLQSPVTILKLWDFLLVPLQGDVTDEHSTLLREQVLSRLTDGGATGLIIDLTGVLLIDSHLCWVISTLAASARLMGTESTICGMRPDIALTLQTMGVELENVRTALTVEDAFEDFGIGRQAKSSGRVEFTHPSSADRRRRNGRRV